MSPPPPPSSGLTEPRFRDALRNLPGRVWVISFGILVNQLGNFLPVFIVLYLTGRGHSAGAAGLVLGMAGVGKVLGNALGGHLADRIGLPIYRIETSASDKLTNIAYGGPERQDLYILDGNGKILVARMPVPGLAMYAHQ